MAKRRREEVPTGGAAAQKQVSEAEDLVDGQYAVGSDDDMDSDEGAADEGAVGSSDEGAADGEDADDGDDVHAGSGDDDDDDEEEEEEHKDNDEDDDDDASEGGLDDSDVEGQGISGGSSGDEGEASGRSGSEEEGGEASSAEPSGSDADVEDGAGGRGGKATRRLPGAKFTEGGKGSSFAKAMAKILSTGRASRQSRVEPEAAAASVLAQAGSAAEGAPPVASAGPSSLRASAVLAVPILAESKSTLKRQAQSEAEVAASKAARKERLERKQRGHVKVPKRGENPAHDLLEKQLARVATRGVVMLFNAVSSAQHESQDALASAKNVEKLSKASFLKQLRSDGGGVAVAGGTAVQVPSMAAAAAVARRPGAASDGGGAVGWKVLQDGFTGLAGGVKMKDWDKEAGEDDSEVEPEQIDGSQSSGSGDDASAW